MYAILRTVKLKTAGNIGGLNAHLERKMEVPNADKDLEHFNRRLIGSGDLVSDVKERLATAEITPRKNAVLAIEHLMTASPEAFELRKVWDENKKEVSLRASKEIIERWTQFEKNSYEWVIKRYGKENLVNFTVHMDEKTPHIHAVVVPIDEKGKLNCRAFLGGREKMRDMQDSFALKQSGLGLERGIKGSKAVHQEVQKYYHHVQEFSKAPAELKIALPVTSLEAPELTIFKQMKQSPDEYVSVQEERLKGQLKEQISNSTELANKQVLELHKAAKISEALKLDNQRLKGQINGLKKELGLSIEKEKKSLQLIKDITYGKISPEELKKSFEPKVKIEPKKDQGFSM